MFKTKSSLSLSELARTYCPLRLTSTIGGSLTILLAKLVVWRLRLAPMCFGIVKRNRRYGSYLDFSWYPLGLLPWVCRPTVAPKIISACGKWILELDIVTISWSMWFNQNAIRQQPKQHASFVLHKCRSLFVEFQLANYTPTRQLVIEDLTWTPSQEPIYKINVDGAVFAQLNASGVGVVIRTPGDGSCGVGKRSSFCLGGGYMWCSVWEWFQNSLKCSFTQYNSTYSYC